MISLVRVSEDLTPKILRTIKEDFGNEADLKCYDATIYDFIIDEGATIVVIFQGYINPFRAYLLDDCMYLENPVKLESVTTPLSCGSDYTVDHKFVCITTIMPDVFKNTQAVNFFISSEKLSKNIELTKLKATLGD